MVIPPSYGDLGKSAKDLFDKGFNYGSSKIDLKTKTGSGIEFTTKGSSSHDTGKIVGSLETKYKQPQHGLTFTDKWTTDNNISMEVAIEDQIATGLKLTLCTSYSPNTGKTSGSLKTAYKYQHFNVALTVFIKQNKKKKAGSLKTAYKRDYINMNLNTDFDFAGPNLAGSAVLGYEGWQAGYQFGFDTSKSALTKNNVALGYKGNDFQLLFNANDTTQFGGSIYHCVSSKLATGVQLSWTAGQNNTSFGVASKYAIDSDASLSTKVNNAGQVGVGYSHNLRKGVKLTLSSLIDAKNFNAGGHKVGFGLEFEV